MSWVKPWYREAVSEYIPQAEYRAVSKQNSSGKAQAQLVISLYLHLYWIFSIKQCYLAFFFKSMGII